MNTHSKPLISKCLTILLFSLVLIGCDGGIFGTGDGGPDQILINPVASSESTDDVDVGAAPPMTPSAPPETPTESSAPGAGGDDPESGSIDSTSGEISEFNAIDDVVVSSTTPIEFTNSYVVNENSITELEFINLTGSSVAVYTSNDPSANSIASTNSSTVIAKGELPNTTNALYIDSVSANGNRTNLTTIQPLTLTPGSHSLLVLRSIAPTVDVIAVPVVSGNPGDNQVAVRLVSAALVGDPEVASVFTLKTIPQNTADLESVTISFAPLTYESPVSGFRLVRSGTVMLNDDAGRYVNVQIELPRDNSVVTVILDPTLPNQHLVQTR